MSTLKQDNYVKAFKAFVAAGGNVAKTRRLLKEQELEVTDKTLRKWAKDMRFTERMERADALIVAEQKGYKQKAFSMAMQQLEQYQMYMIENPAPDPQMAYAMRSLHQLVQQLGIEGKMMPDNKTEKERLAEFFELAGQVYGIDFSKRRESTDETGQQVPLEAFSPPEEPKGPEAYRELKPLELTKVAEEKMRRIMIAQEPDCRELTRQLKPAAEIVADEAAMKASGTSNKPAPWSSTCVPRLSATLDKHF